MRLNGYHTTSTPWRSSNWDPKEGRIVGIELEHESRGPEIMREILVGVDAVLPSQDDFIAETDGSLRRDGSAAEFISRPFSYKDVLKSASPPRKLLNYLRSFSPGSQRENVGLHVSVNGRAYDNPRALQWFFNAGYTLSTIVGRRVNGFGEYTGGLRYGQNISKYYPAVHHPRSGRVEVRLFRSPDTEEQLQHSIVYALSGAEWADKNDSLIQKLDKEEDYSVVDKQLKEGYLNYLSSRRGSMKRELFDFLNSSKNPRNLPYFAKNWQMVRQKKKAPTINYEVRTSGGTWTTVFDPVANTNEIVGDIETTVSLDEILRVREQLNSSEEARMSEALAAVRNRNRRGGPWT